MPETFLPESAFSSNVHIRPCLILYFIFMSIFLMVLSIICVTLIKYHDNWYDLTLNVMNGIDE